VQQQFGHDTCERGFGWDKCLVELSAFCREVEWQCGSGQGESWSYRGSVTSFVWGSSSGRDIGILKLWAGMIGIGHLGIVLVGGWESVSLISDKEHIDGAKDSCLLGKEGQMAK